MDTTAEKIERDGLTARIMWTEDTSYCDPRDCDQLGVMLCWHPHYELGDEQFTREDFDADIANVLRHVIEERKAVGPILPLYLYDHSGITMRTGRAIDPSAPEFRMEAPFALDSQGWDTSWVGFIFATPETLEMTGAPVDSIERQLEGEVSEYASWLEGDVYYVVVEDEDGEEMDSCGGFIGIGVARDYATEMLECCVAEQADKAATEARESAWAARMGIPTEA